MEEENLGIASSSIQSRIEIIMKSGMEQMAVNPIAGDLAADVIVGKPGYYIHSILSVQSHLGLIGSILLFLFLFERILNIYTHKGNVIIKIISIPIMMMAVIATFFTWMPLWFLIGALYAMRRF